MQKLFGGSFDKKRKEKRERVQKRQMLNVTL